MKSALLRTLHVVALAGLVIAVALLAAACSKPEPATPEADVSVVPLPADRAEMQVPAPDGKLPCGLAQVGWGYRVANLADFPACAASVPNLTVMCLDAQAQWSAANITNIEVSQDTNTVVFEVQQEGLCALFPTAP